jgi:hypothetical protein
MLSYCKLTEDKASPVVAAEIAYWVPQFKRRLRALQDEGRRPSRDGTTNRVAAIEEED